MKKEQNDSISVGGGGLGCGFMILCAGIALALLRWTAEGFPKFWQ